MITPAIQSLNFIFLNCVSLYFITGLENGSSDPVMSLSVQGMAMFSSYRILATFPEKPISLIMLVVVRMNFLT